MVRKRERGPSLENVGMDNLILQVMQYWSNLLRSVVSLGIMKETLSLLRMEAYMRAAVRWLASWRLLAMAVASADSGERTIE